MNKCLKAIGNRYNACESQTIGLNMQPTIIHSDEARLLPWARERIGVAAFRSDARTIGIERGGQLRGVIVFDNFSDVDCHMHVASDGSGHWITRDLLVHVFGYVFIQCKLLRVTGMVDSANEAALRFDEHLGFKREGFHPLAGNDGGDAISLGLLRSACKFIPKQYRTALNQGASHG